MSVLDQALTKAYDKPPARPPAPPSGPHRAERSAAAPAANAANVAAIERLYHEGGLYRVDAVAASATAATGATARSRNNRSSLAGPHYLVPPPTSPKRGVRRSLLRLVSNQADAAASAAELDPPEPPPVRRKVIIRHVSHGAPVPRPHLPLAPQPETPSEKLVDAASEPVELPSLPEIAPSIEVHGHWDSAAIAPALVFLPDSADPRMAVQESLVRVHLDALPEPDHREVWTAVEPPASAPPTLSEQSFAAKSLDDDHPPLIRADQAHAGGPRKPHWKKEEAPKAAPPPAPTPTELQPVEELSLADEVAAAADRPTESDAPAETAAPASAPTAAPVWEVDRFHWPRTCEKLLADDRGYLASAGNKLQAAVRDGLKILAITGSRRGEGRTTLALCLARVAARVGIQVALLDADFARPSLASRLGLEITHGWQDAALGHIPLSEAAVKSLEENITVLPLEITAARRTLSLADPRVTATLRAAAATFELVIVDLGPLGPGEELAFPPGEKCPLDATIVVRDLRFASAAESRDVGERLYESGIEAVGVAENFVLTETPDGTG